MSSLADKTMHADLRLAQMPVMMSAPGPSADEMNAPEGYKFAGYAPAPSPGEVNPG
jgi:uncharacterized glyoxalase superfamily protein PhnB